MPRGFFVHGIRRKLILTLMVAVLVPLVIGIASLHFLGNRYYLAQRGALYQVMAGQIAAGLERGLDDRVAWLSTWVRLTNLAAALPPPGPDAAAQSDASRRAAIDRIEAAWPTLAEADEPLRGILRNPLADALRRYARLNPLVVEILVTDAYGRVVAATNKSSDYDQADEAWWTTAMTRVSPLQAFVEGIAFDESAQVYSIDVSVPLRDASGEAVGVVKAVVNASPLLQSLAPIRGTLTTNRDLVLDTGQVLVRLFGEAVEPFVESVGPGVTEALAEVDTGWRVTPIAGRAHLVGFAQVRCSRRFLHMDYLSDIAPMAVIVYHPHAMVMAPVRGELLRLSVGGLGVAILFGVAGFYIASQRLLKPIDTLRSAAQCIAATAHLGGEERPSHPPAGRAQAEARLREVEDIETHDELDDLARDFALMGQRVLHYNEQLSAELAKRTEEMRQDLNMARQFQESLLPNEYPLVPEADEPCPISLIFRHVYTPTLSVGGDFFDVRKLSPHRASVFIADVMGHGTRSALVTAILHTLLRDADVATANPATLLADINRRFQSIVRRTEDTLFVTAFFMVVDTRSVSVEYACAGHPSPMVVSRPGGKVARLVNEADYGPALGLFDEPHFPCASRDLEPGDCILLYTDGLTEAMNETREEWGEERLQDTLRRAAVAGAQDLLVPTMADVREFIGAAAIHDDICLVSVEALRT